jgi:hypothetical protein
MVEVQEDEGNSKIILACKYLVLTVTFLAALRIITQTIKLLT